MDTAIALLLVTGSTVGVLRARYQWRREIRISSIFIYPIKGMRGCAVDEAELDECGIVGDRRFLVIDGADGSFVTQRTVPAMATLTPQLLKKTSGGNKPQQSQLLISSPYSAALCVDVITSSELDAGVAPRGSARRVVRIWSSQVANAVDQGDEAGAWLSSTLGVANLRLVYMDQHCLRPIVDKLVDVTDRIVAFTDGFPLLLLGEASVADLNLHATESIPHGRFRTNLLVSHAPAYAEDFWMRFTIGKHAIPFWGAKRCSRCRVTTTDQVRYMSREKISCSGHKLTLIMCNSHIPHAMHRVLPL